MVGGDVGEGAVFLLVLIVAVFPVFDIPVVSYAVCGVVANVVVNAFVVVTIMTADSTIAAKGPKTTLFFLTFFWQLQYARKWNTSESVAPPSPPSYTHICLCRSDTL